ncbi:Hypothetical predicted protein, partial [Xyrichtys novacula]
MEPPRKRARETERRGGMEKLGVWCRGVSPEEGEAWGPFDWQPNENGAGGQERGT